jgi:hypothetical protein
MHYVIATNQGYVNLFYTLDKNGVVQKFNGISEYDDINKATLFQYDWEAKGFMEEVYPNHAFSVIPVEVQITKV